MAHSLKLLLIALVTLPVSLTVILCSPFSAHGKLGYSVSRIWAWAILKIGGVKLKVEGLGRLDSGRPYIFIANHQRDRKSTRLNSSHIQKSRMPSSA